jgi:hypothetical protein
MGWGTFAAYQALRVTRKWSSAINASENTPFFGPIFFWVLSKFHQSYIRRVFRGTVIMHPSIWDSVDLDYWEEAISRRAGKDWRILVLIQIVVLAVGISTFWQLIFLYVPAFWYYGKWQAIKIYSTEINKEFAAEGFDIPKLYSEIPALLEDERQARQKQMQRDLKRQEDEDYKRKFGKKKS